MQQADPIIQLLVSGGSIVNNFGFALGFGASVLALSYLIHIRASNIREDIQQAGMIFVGSAAALNHVGIALAFIGQAATLWGIYRFWGSEQAQLSLPLLSLVTLLYCALLGGASLLLATKNESLVGWSIVILGWVLIQSTQIIPTAALQSPRTAVAYALFIALFSGAVYGVQRLSRQRATAHTHHMS